MPNQLTPGSLKQDKFGVDLTERVGVETTDIYVRITFEYEDGTTRTYDLNFPKPIDYEAVAAAKSVIMALSQSTETDEAFKTFFVSDEGAHFAEIKSAELRSVTEETVW